MIVEFDSNIRILDADIAENEDASDRIGMLNGLDDGVLFALHENKLS